MDAVMSYGERHLLLAPDSESLPLGLASEVLEEAGVAGRTDEVQKLVEVSTSLPKDSRRGSKQEDHFSTRDLTRSSQYPPSLKLFFLENLHAIVFRGGSKGKTNP